MPCASNTKKILEVSHCLKIHIVVDAAQKGESGCKYIYSLYHGIKNTHGDYFHARFQLRHWQWTNAREAM